MIGQDKQVLEIAYLALGRLIAAECPVGFASATLRMENDENGTRLWIGAAQPDGTKVQLQPGPGAAQDILESLRGIRNAGAGEDGALWHSCTVTLRAGGHFAMEVEY
jgi:hypothetical protein